MTELLSEGLLSFPQNSLPADELLLHELGIGRAGHGARGESLFHGEDFEGAFVEDGTELFPVGKFELGDRDFALLG